MAAGVKKQVWIDGVWFPSIMGAARELSMGDKNLVRILREHGGEATVKGRRVSLNGPAAPPGGQGLPARAPATKEPGIPKRWILAMKVPEPAAKPVRTKGSLLFYPPGKSPLERGINHARP
jgi:hypothetical protein